MFDSQPFAHCLGDSFHAGQASRAGHSASEVAFLRRHDVHAARAHYANNPDKPGRNLGAVQLSMKNTDFFI